MQDKKDAYVRKLKAKIDEWNSDIDALAAKTQRDHPEIKTQCKQRIATLQAKIKDTEEMINTAHDAGAAAWKELKRGTQASADSLMERFSKARSKFEKAYSPERNK